MKENITLFRKATDGTASPEGWVAIGGHRRACIQRMGANEGLAVGAALNEMNVVPSHRVLVDASSDYEVGRLLVRSRDGANFLIRGVQEAGKRTPVGYREMLLIVSKLNPEVVTL
jgi:hypothetical protein